MNIDDLIKELNDFKVEISGRLAKVETHLSNHVSNHSYNFKWVMGGIGMILVAVIVGILV